MTSKSIFQRTERYTSPTKLRGKQRLRLKFEDIYGHPLPEGTKLTDEEKAGNSLVLAECPSCRGLIQVFTKID